jgi:diacylglycerol kinase family enzyme
VVVAGGDGSIGAVVNELGEAGALRAGGDSGDDFGDESGDGGCGDHSGGISGGISGGDTEDDSGGGGNSGGGHGVALAALPMGNENLFAKHFGFTRDIKKLASAVEAGRTHRVDLGRVDPGGHGTDGRLFTLMAGVGFDAEVVRRMDRWRSAPARTARGQRRLRRVRRASYLPRIASALWGYRYPMMTVQVDGRELVGAQLFVFNLPAYGGGLGIAPPGCRGDDGLLDWVLFERPGSAPLPGYAWSVWRGGHLDRPDIKHGRAAVLTVSSPAGVPVQADGDPAGLAPVAFRVDTQAHLELLIT